MADLNDYIFTKEKKHFLARVIWSLLYITFTCMTVGLVATLWHEFISNPVITTLETTMHPVSKVPFPGVAICSINKISRRRAEDFAELMYGQEVFDLQAKNQSMFVSEALSVVELFGRLYDYEYDTEDEALITKAQEILDELNLNTIDVMEMLTGRCEDLLEFCKWGGVRVDCLDIFKRRRTYDGYCCTFNYIKNTTRYKKVPPGMVPIKGEAGIGKGLNVKIKNNLHDYFYSPLNSEGVTVQIFIPTDYPDKTSGGMTDVIVGVNTETFIQIKPTTVVTVKDVIHYPLSKRECLFEEERITTFGDVYSESDCNVECRVASSLALCECVPFMVPLSAPENVCTLRNLECLSRYKSKWSFMYPEDDTSEFLKREKYDSLRCNQRCYSSCDETSYHVFSDSAIIHNSKEENCSNIHVYFSKKVSDVYKQDVVYYWFEIISNFGGTFGLVIGMSVVSVIEFSVFCLQLLRNKYHT